MIVILYKRDYHKTFEVTLLAKKGNNNNTLFQTVWDETTGDKLTDAWGTSTYYFETEENGDVLRQLEVFANGKRLTYTPDYLQDESGGLSEVPLDLVEFEEFRIPKNEFEDAWQQ